MGGGYGLHTPLKLKNVIEKPSPIPLPPPPLLLKFLNPQLHFIIIFYLFLAGSILPLR